MSIERVTYALLSGAGAVTSIVGTRIYPVVLPQGQGAPALVYEPISATRAGAIDAYATTHLTRGRVQVNLVVATYPELHPLREAVKAAMQFQRGLIGGVTVHSIVHAGEGPVQYDQQLGLFSQPIDFLIHHEAN